MRSHRLRSFLSALGITIGIAAVILLTSIGEGTRLFLVTEFTQFGTNLLVVLPGRTETLGIPGVLGGTTHKLTLADCAALERLPGVERVLPVAYGQARVEGNGRGRSVFVYGVTADVPDTWKIDVAAGSFLPRTDPQRSTLVVVLGSKLKRELFGDDNALGKFVRVAGLRLRVVGVMAPKGRMLDLDVDDSAYVPVATGLQMFNLDELGEVDVLIANRHLTDQVAEGIRSVLRSRHGGREDFTVTTQTAMLGVLNNVMDVVTFAVGAIAGVSLLVGAIGIFTMMWIAVGERVQEIGLLRALGATSQAVLRIFLLEAVVLTMFGGVAGIGLGLGLTALLGWVAPGLPTHTPGIYVLLALGVSFATGVFAGVAPARRAAALHPVEALRAE